MGILTKEQFFEPKEQKTKKVMMPEWSKEAYILVRDLDAYALVRINANGGGKDIEKNPFGYLCDVVYYGWVDEKGNRVCNSKKDLNKITEKGFAVLQRVSDAILILSGMAGKKDKKKIR